MNIRRTIIAALLCAIGIIIPMFSPVKIVLEPASFTLASHVAIFMAMFISPSTAIFVSLGTTVGFLLGGFPITVVMRALSHIVFVVVGALYIKKHRGVIKSIKSSILYSLGIALIHGICEVLIILPFYFNSSLTQGYYDKGFLVSVIGLVGIGTIVHSMIDFALSVYIWNLMPKEITSQSETDVAI